MKYIIIAKITAMIALSAVACRSAQVQPEYLSGFAGSYTEQGVSASKACRVSIKCEDASNTCVVDASRGKQEISIETEIVELKADKMKLRSHLQYEVEQVAGSPGKSKLRERVHMTLERAGDLYKGSARTVQSFLIPLGWNIIFNSCENLKKEA